MCLYVFIYRQSASPASPSTRELLPNTLVAQVDVDVTESRVVVTKMSNVCSSETKTGNISVKSFFFRPSLYKYMLFARIERPMLVVLLPLRQSQIPFPIMIHSAVMS
jgi:hypothetical protein